MIAPIGNGTDVGDRAKQKIIHRGWSFGYGAEFKSLIPLVAILALAACASGKPPRTAEITLPVAFDSAAKGGAIQSLDRWWMLYGDLQLTELTNRALAQGFSVREAIARLEESRALRSVALAKFGPQGNLQGNAEYRETQDLERKSSTTGAGLPAGSSAGTTRSASLSFPVSWELDFFGRREATRLSAEADIAAAGFDIEAARAAIAAEVARALFQARGIHVQLEEARETTRIQHELLRVIVERAARGLAASSEADRIAGDVAQAEAQAADLDAALTASRRALLAVTGDGTDSLAKLEIKPTLGVVPAVPAAMPSELLARRPDVRLAAARIQRSVSNVRLAELDFFPRLTLNPGVGLSAQRGAFDATTSFWSIAAGLMVPLLDRRRLHALLRAEGARAEQSVLAYERIVQTAFSEADQSLVRLAADRRRVDLLVNGEARARKAYDAALKRYQLGFANLTELLDSERSWRATRVALTNARIDALQRSVQVFQALGGGWDVRSTAADRAKEVHDEK